MTQELLYLGVGMALVFLGLCGTVASRDPVRRVLALNITGTGIFLVLVTVAARGRPDAPDPVPHALVLTGIVVAVSVTAVALALVRRVAELPQEDDPADDGRGTR